MVLDIKAIKGNRPALVEAEGRIKNKETSTQWRRDIRAREHTNNKNMEDITNLGISIPLAQGRLIMDILIPKEDIKNRETSMLVKDKVISNKDSLILREVITDGMTSVLQPAKVIRRKHNIIPRAFREGIASKATLILLVLDKVSKSRDSLIPREFKGISIRLVLDKVTITKDSTKKPLTPLVLAMEDMKNKDKEEVTTKGMLVLVVPDKVFKRRDSLIPQEFKGVNRISIPLVPDKITMTKDSQIPLLRHQGDTTSRETWEVVALCKEVQTKKPLTPLVLAMEDMKNKDKEEVTTKGMLVLVVLDKEMDISFPTVGQARENIKHRGTSIPLEGTRAKAHCPPVSLEGERKCHKTTCMSVDDSLTVQVIHTAALEAKVRNYGC